MRLRSFCSMAHLESCGHTRHARNTIPGGEWDLCRRGMSAQCWPNAISRTAVPVCDNVRCLKPPTQSQTAIQETIRKCLPGHHSNGPRHSASCNRRGSFFRPCAYCSPHGRHRAWWANIKCQGRGFSGRVCGKKHCCTNHADCGEHQGGAIAYQLDQWYAQGSRKMSKTSSTATAQFDTNTVWFVWTPPGSHKMLCQMVTCEGTPAAAGSSGADRCTLGDVSAAPFCHLAVPR